MKTLDWIGMTMGRGGMMPVLQGGVPSIQRRKNIIQCLPISMLAIIL
jgi:hypothetical protein